MVAEKVDIFYNLQLPNACKRYLKCKQIDRSNYRMIVRKQFSTCKYSKEVRKMILDLGCILQLFFILKVCSSSKIKSKNFYKFNNVKAFLLSIFLELLTLLTLHDYLLIIICFVLIIIRIS